MTTARRERARNTHTAPRAARRPRKTYLKLTSLPPPPALLADVGPSRVRSSARLAYLIDADADRSFLNVVYQALLKEGHLVPAPLYVRAPNAAAALDTSAEEESSSADESAGDGGGDAGAARVRRRNPLRAAIAVRQRGALTLTDRRRAIFAQAATAAGRDPSFAAAEARQATARRELRAANVERIRRAIATQGTGTAATPTTAGTAGQGAGARADAADAGAHNGGGALIYPATTMRPSDATFSWLYCPIAFGALGYRGGDIDGLRDMMGADFFNEVVGAYAADFAARGITAFKPEWLDSPYHLRSHRQELLLAPRNTLARSLGESGLSATLYERIRQWATTSQTTARAAARTHRRARRARSDTDE